jgi:hypothetical protein
MPPYRNMRIGPFFGGLNDDENPHALEAGELQNAHDIARRGNLVGTRPGLVPLGTGEDYENDLTGTPVIQGAFEYRKDYDEGRRLITIAHHGTSKIWYEDDARLPIGGSPPTISTDQDYIWSFDLHNNLLWATGGPADRQSVTTESIWTWDGVVGTGAIERALTDKGTTDRLRPKFVKTWRNYVLVAGLQGGTVASNNPAVVRFATFGTDATLDASWPDGNTIGFNATRVGLDAFGGSYSTGFGEYQDNEGDFLMLLSNRGLAAAKLDTTFGNDFIITDAISNGCVHERAFVPLGLDSGDAVYVSEHGVHSLRQSQRHGAKEDAFLSWKIRNFWKTLNRNRLPMTCGAYDRQNGRVLFAFSTGAASTHNVIMCLDVKDISQDLNAKNARWYGPWTIRDSGGAVVGINHMEYIRDGAAATTNENRWSLYCFTTTGGVLRFDEDVHQDLGANGYAPIMRSKDFDFGNTLTEKRVGDAMVTISPAGEYAVTMRTIFDLGARANVSTVQLKSSASGIVGTGTVGTSTVGTDFIPTEDKVYLTGRGRTVGIEFTHSGADQPFFVGAVDMQISGAGEDPGGSA